MQRFMADLILIAVSVVTLQSGRFILTEFIEEYPPLVAFPGMASRIVTYCKPQHEGFARHATEDGEIEPLDEEGALPHVLPHLQVAAQETMIMSSSLYHAPMFDHTAEGEDTQDYTDFVMVLVRMLVCEGCSCWVGGSAGGRTTATDLTLLCARFRGHTW